MSEHQPLFQFGTPLRDTDPGYAILRLDSDEDIEKAIAIINRANEVLTPLVEGFVDTLTRALQGQGGQLVGQLQQAGLNPVPVPQQAYQPQAQSSQAYAPPAQQQPMPQQAAPQRILMQGPCWASTRHAADCKDCGGPTYLKVMTIRGTNKVNAHQCANHPDHKVVWCETPIWNSRKATAMGQGIEVPEGLVYG